MDAAAMILVVKKREPNLPSVKPNLERKNHVTQELYCTVIN